MRLNYFWISLISTITVFSLGYNSYYLTAFLDNSSEVTYSDKLISSWPRVECKNSNETCSGWVEAPIDRNGKSRTWYKFVPNCANNQPYFIDVYIDDISISTVGPFGVSSDLPTSNFCLPESFTPSSGKFEVNTKANRGNLRIFARIDSKSKEICPGEQIKAWGGTLEQIIEHR